MGKYSDILFASDFDKTFTDLEHNMLDVNVKAVEDFISQGGAFTIATGRARCAFAHIVGDVPINAPCIYSNGALTYDHSNDKIENYHVFPEETERFMLELAERFPGLCTEMYTPNEEIYILNPTPELWRHMELLQQTPLIVPVDEIKRPWLKTVFAGGKELLEQARIVIEESGINLIGVNSLPYMLDIQRKDVSKGRAARELAASLGRRTLVCAGDAPNDLSMLEAADVAFIPESAHAELHGRGMNVVVHADKGSIADAIGRLDALLEGQR